jgi:sensor histidine kinase YesM
MLSKKHPWVRGSKSIRNRLMAYFLMIVMMTGIISLYTSYNSSRLLVEIEEMFNLSVLLDGIEQDLTTAHDALSIYVETKSSDALNTFMEAVDSLNSEAHTLMSTYRDKRSALSVKNIQNMIDKYTEYGSSSILAKRGRDISGSRKAFLQATETKDLIQDVIDKLKIEQLDQNIMIYQNLVKNGTKVQLYNVLMILTVMALTILIVLEVTLKMTKPIIQLSKAADEIAHGKFDGEEVAVDTEDEVHVMADAFNQMKLSIVGYIDELHKANEVEKKWIENELQNAKMQTLLNDAELRSLQSQINPHFLFNSLNAGVQLAMMEEADKTLSFLENLSTLFRYNIRPLDQLVEIREEIHHIQSYCELMKMRFGDKVTYSVESSESLMHHMILPMILQPIVENAFIHGIGQCEAGGHVSIAVIPSDLGIQMIVKDTGGGVESEKISRILNKDSSGVEAVVTPKRSHSSGIGAGNVVQRLKLMYGERASIQFFSNRNEGTTVTIEIPDTYKEVSND